MPELAFPEKDRHFARRDGYQSRILKAALPHCRGTSLAIDVGAHIGLITRQMEKSFDHVVAFEPEATNFACLKHNVSTATLYGCALSDVGGMMALHNPKPSNSGAWECTPHETGNGKVTKIIRLDWCGLFRPDFIKIDVQGHELRVLKGAVENIEASRPVIAVECWRDGKRDNGPRHFLENMGYVVVVDTLGKDLILAYPMEEK